MDTKNEPTSEKDNEELIVLRKKQTLDSKAYAKLYRGFNSKSVTNITIKPELPPKPRPESLRANLDDLKKKYSPVSFGYPKSEKRQEEKPQQDENCNVIKEECSDSDSEYRIIVCQQAKSRESIDKIEQELNNFTMDRSKEKKRTSSFRKLFTGGLFGKDKKKKEEEKNIRAQNDNLQNESYNRQIQNDSYNKQNQTQSYNASYLRHNQSQGPTTNESFNKSNYQSQGQYQQPQNDSFNRQDSYRRSHESYRRADDAQQPLNEEKLKEVEQSYAEMHLSRFNQIRKNFTKTQEYVPMEPKPKKSISDYLTATKYIDTSSSTSSSETAENKPPRDFRQTPPRADENNYQNFKVVKPKATHVVAPFKNETPEKPAIAPRSINNDISSENRGDQSPNEINEPRTIERNLDRNHSDKDTYGTVFDSLEYLSRNGEMKPVNQSPKSLEGSKLKLPPNREIVSLQPRVKSPIPSNRISTEKIIATELLRNSRSPTPPRKPKQEEIEANVDGVLKGKPPISPKVILSDPRQEKPKIVDRNLNQTDRMAPRIDSTSSINKQDIYNSTNGIYATNRSSNNSGKITSNGLYNRTPNERYVSLDQSEQNRQYGSTVFTFDETPRTNHESSYGYTSKTNDRGSAEIYNNKNEHGLNNQDIYVTRGDLYGTTTNHKPDTITTNVMVHVPSPTKPPSMVDLRRSSTPVSPQKEDIRKSVEAYYWKELKKMKEKEDYELYMMQVHMEETARLRRSRSLSPNARMGRRSLSLPRDVKGINERPIVPQHDVYGRIQRQQFQPQAIPEGKPLYFDNNNKVRRTLTYEQNFVRNTPERNTVGSISREGYYRPIFRRGSLTKQEMINQNLNKKVSFNAQQNWPTKNGYTVSPPQRRLEPVKSVDDEVFLPEPMYQYYPVRQQYYAPEVEYVYYPQVYSSRQSLAELPPPPPQPQPIKQINVHNKICDIYGQIHDTSSIQKSGVIMGQLQRSPQTPRHNYNNSNFIRGTRLTASANDMQRFYHPVRSNNNYGPPARPLPPVPRKNPTRMSDTESGSDAGEVQRIMSKAKNKKGGLFGK